MSNEFERECLCNVPAWHILERIDDRKDWSLYLCDCYWVLEMDGGYEFYFHPMHFIARVEKARLPGDVIQRIRTQCKCFTDADRRYWDSRERAEPASLRPSGWRLEKLDGWMTIGNWFYAQGEAYVTVDGKFIRNDPYMDRGERECDLNDINWHQVEDMLRMTASTRTHHYMEGLYDLPCFRGIAAGCMRNPPEAFDWDSGRWAATYGENSRRLRRGSDPESRVALRDMRKEVFQNTVFLVGQKRYYPQGDREISFPDSHPMIKNTVFYSKRIVLPPHLAYGQCEVYVENVDCLVAAKKLLEAGYDPAVLNMASRQRPGGGVLNGAGAQEENLFRRTNLFQSLFQFSPFAGEYDLPASPHQYPLDRNYGGVYSPDVVVFRGEERDGYPLLEEYFQVGVISVPGMNRPALDPNGNVASHLVDHPNNK